MLNSSTLIYADINCVHISKVQRQLKVNLNVDWNQVPMLDIPSHCLIVFN